LYLNTWHVEIEDMIRCVLSPEDTPFKTLEFKTYWRPVPLHTDSSMENLADISAPQIPSNEQNDQRIHFSNCIFWIQC